MKVLFSNSKPKYIELYEEISKLINQGILKANEKLPSKRTLALDLNVSLNTIINAYNLLLDEGFIYSIEKKGYFVVDQLVVTLKNENVINTVSKDNKIIYDFTTQNVEGFADTNWKRIIKSVLDSHEYLNKTNCLGDISLRNAIARHLYNNRGINVSSEQIIIGSGMEMLENIINCIKIDNITLENPGYHKLNNIVNNLGLKSNYIDLDEQGCMIPNVKTILYTTPFNQFPTGIKMSISRKKELVHFAETTDSYIIEDDFDAEFRINSNPTTALYSLSNDRVIFFSTFSTTIYPGLRIAYAILPIKVLEVYRQLYKSFTCSVPTLEQLALKCFIDDGYYASHINKRKKLYLKKRNLCLSILNENGIKYDEKRNYLSILIECDNDHIKEKCKNMGISIQSLNDFDIKKRGKNCLILGYTAIPYDKIHEGLKLLIKILKGSLD